MMSASSAGSLGGCSSGSSSYRSTSGASCATVSAHKTGLQTWACSGSSGAGGSAGSTTLGTEKRHVGSLVGSSVVGR